MIQSDRRLSERMIVSLAFFKALPRFAVSPSAFNAGLFLADFRSELRRCGTPQFRSRPWWNALARADEHDNWRRLVAYYARVDAHEPQTVRLYERFFSETVAPKMNGKVLRWVATESEFRTLSKVRRDGLSI
jgi:hypothetical protein